MFLITGWAMWIACLTPAMLASGILTVSIGLLIFILTGKNSNYAFVIMDFFTAWQDRLDAFKKEIEDDK